MILTLLDEFTAAMTAAGITPPASLVADGMIHRFPTNGRRDDDAGWYVLHDDGIAAGAFGDFRSGITGRWCSRNPDTMSEAERVAHRARMDSIVRQREEEERQRHVKAAVWADEIWKASCPATEGHGYLTKKHVKPHGARICQASPRPGWLVVPMCDVDGYLLSLAFIARDGEKWFLPGGRKQGCMFVLGTITETAVVCLVEGFATGASVHEATGYVVAVAFDKANLLRVARALRAAHPQVTILVCGDNDNDGGGQAKAQEAAEAVGGLPAIPKESGMDWNDVAARDGHDSVRNEIAAVLRAYPGVQMDDQPNEAEVFSGSLIEEWPTLDEAALYGVFGDIVKTVGPHTEADDAAILLQNLVAFGSTLNRGPHFRAEADYHAMNLYVTLVGETSKGRKGTSWGQVRRLSQAIDPDWAEARVMTGLSSGEGLIWQVRDEITKSEPIKESGRYTGEVQLVVTDPGVTDKRLLVLESEFANVLAVMRRDGNTLSAVLRQAWDSGDLRAMTKNSSAKSTGAHVSIIAHITKDELLRLMETTEAANGFANRFLWVCSRRSKCLPEGGTLSDSDLFPLADRLKKALNFARSVGELRRNEAARALWREVYPTLSAGTPGLLGAVTSRAEAITMRLACLYALGDMSYVVTPDHLTAALAVWEYCEASARYIFGQRLGDPVADELLKALRQSPTGMTRTAIRDWFGRNRKAHEIDRGLELLARQGLAHKILEQTGTRPVERWFAGIGSTTYTTNTTNPPIQPGDMS